MLAGEREPDCGELVIGPRVSAGFFTQLQARRDFAGRVAIDVVLELEGHNLLLLDEPTDNLDIESSGNSGRGIPRPRLPANHGPLPGGPARRNGPFAAYVRLVEALIDPAGAAEVRLAKIL